MTYLIDGYNLLHAIGLANRSLPAKGLERARTRLLDWLADQLQGRDDVLRVVFDAQKSPAPSSEFGHRGIRVCFAFRRTADELIEELIQGDLHPKRVTVVSNDVQVQESGRQRGCAILTCQEFVDWMIAKPAAAEGASGEHEEKPATPEEMAAWLEAFSQPKKRRKP